MPRPVHQMEHHHSHHSHENHEKNFTQNNQQMGKDQLWLKKFVLHQRHFPCIVGKNGAIMEAIRKFTSARIKYGNVVFNANTLLVLIKFIAHCA